jgi:putative mRNA 3-end processing factor
MPHYPHWIKINPAGLYCEAGDFYIDPHFPVPTALITHGHADHARSGHQRVFATKETLAIMQTRYGEQFTQTQHTAKYHETFHFNKVRVFFLPAGHILGSAQIVVEYKGTRVVISGDYKRIPDPTCPPFEAIAADFFITEATFGLPFFQHPPIEEEIDKLLLSLQRFPDRTHVIGCYALGKCQRLIMGLREKGYDKAVYLHGAMKKLCDLYETLGISLGKREAVTVENKKKLAGEIVLCPPSALHTPWTRGMPEVIHGLASGWMQVRARAKQKGIELPLVISDHADWQQLTRTIHEVNADEVWVTHGNEEALLHYLQKNHIKAKALSDLKIEREEDEE